MDNLYEISMLLDFYGQLLTKRQYEVLDLHYNSDYSLGEIAQYFNISRQGVYDNVKRAKAALENLEKKLGLISRFLEQKRKAAEILKMLDDIDCSQLPEQSGNRLEEARHAVKDIMED